MGLLVAISLDEEMQRVPDLGPSTLAKTFPETLQSCLYVTGLGPTQLNRAGVPADTFLVSTHFPCLVPINTVGFQTLMDTLWLQVRAAQGCRLPTRSHTNETFTAQTLLFTNFSKTIKQQQPPKPWKAGGWTYAPLLRDRSQADWRMCLLVNFGILNSMLLVWHSVDVFCWRYGSWYFQHPARDALQRPGSTCKGMGQNGCMEQGRELS